MEPLTQAKFLEYKERANKPGMGVFTAKAMRSVTAEIERLKSKEKAQEIVDFIRNNPWTTEDIFWILNH